jgi:hypothetical protein
MADRIFASNDGPNKGYANEVHVFEYLTSGNLTADATAKVVAMIPPQLAGRIVAAYLSVGTNGVDATNPLNLELDVLVNGTSALTTKPKIDKTAGTGKKNTIAAGTGITVGVLDSTKTAVAAGDHITATLDITRTASPSTEIADVAVVVVIRPAAA